MLIVKGSFNGKDQFLFLDQIQWFNFLCRKYANNQTATSRSDMRNQAIGHHQAGPSTSSPSSSSSEGYQQEYSSLPPSTSNLHTESDNNYGSSSPGASYPSETEPRSDDVVRRRNAVLEATLRRLNQQQL